ncbi:hypothetical protein MKW92_009641 [Papaver armeniacum]|nr:hypothetical protein MKW92_009641 [Papaver armeniacum]
MASHDEFRLVSSAIAHEGKLPRKYTEEGQGAAKTLSSPPLEWYNVPDGTKSLAIVVQDLDADVIPWTAWVEGNNDHKVPGWRVPMLPEPGHRFVFKLYALDDLMHLGHKVTKEKLIDAVEGHVLGEAVLLSIF